MKEELHKLLVSHNMGYMIENNKELINDICILVKKRSINSSLISFTESDHAVLDEAIIKYGVNAQIIKAIEEFSELNQVLCRFLNGRYSMEDLAGEMVDATIMLEQLWKIFPNLLDESEFSDEVRDAKKFKIERLNERINKCSRP